MDQYQIMIPINEIFQRIQRKKIDWKEKEKDVDTIFDRFRSI